MKERFKSCFATEYTYKDYNETPIKNIAAAVSHTSDKKLPDGSEVKFLGDTGFIYNLTDISRLIVLFSLGEEHASIHKLVAWIPQYLSWVLFPVAFNGSESIVRFNKLVGAGIGADNQLKPPASGKTFKLIHSQLVAGLDPDLFSKLIEALSTLSLIHISEPTRRS